MAKRKRYNYFKAGKTYWTIIFTYKKDNNPNTYCLSWTVSGRWWNVAGVEQPRVYHTKDEADAAALLLAAKSPEKIGNIEAITYCPGKDFRQEAV